MPERLRQTRRHAEPRRRTQFPGASGAAEFCGLGGRIWLVRRSGQDSTAFECRVLAANRNPVADPMPAETMFPLSELHRMLAAVRHGPAHCRRKRKGETQFPTIGLFERNADNFKGQPENTKAQKSWSSRDCGRDTHYWAPPAQNRTGSFPAYGSHLGCLTAGLGLPYALRRR